VAFCLQDVIGKRDDEIVAASIPGVREAMAIKQTALETGVTATGEITLVLPEVCTHWMITCEPRRAKNNEVVGVAFAAVNITETVCQARQTLQKPLSSNTTSRFAFLLLVHWRRVEALCCLRTSRLVLEFPCLKHTFSD
jgi:hypothetical protein